MGFFETDGDDGALIGEVERVQFGHQLLPERFVRLQAEEPLDLVGIIVTDRVTGTGTDFENPPIGRVEERLFDVAIHLIADLKNFGESIGKDERLPVERVDPVDRIRIAELLYEGTGKTRDVELKGDEEGDEVGEDEFEQSG